jgi:hypothetical protein
MATFKLTIGSKDDFNSQDSLMNLEKQGNRATFEVEISISALPKGFVDMDDFMFTVLIGMACREGWCMDGSMSVMEEYE